MRLDAENGGMLDIERLQQAAQQFAAAQTAGNFSAQRTAVNDTLAVLASAARDAAAGADPWLLRPLIALMGALADANAGKANDLLRPARKPRKPGAPPLPREQANCYAEAAAAIDILMEEAGETKERAVGHVKQSLASAGIKLPGRLDKARDRVTSGEHGEGALAHHRFLASYLSGKTEMTPQEKVQRLLGLIIERQGRKRNPSNPTY